MKRELYVTSLSKISEDRMLVQLQGEHGHASLNVSISENLKIGQKFCLGPCVENDEEAENNPELQLPEFLRATRNIKLSTGVSE
jgi:hypothetical protein